MGVIQSQPGGRLQGVFSGASAIPVKQVSRIFDVYRSSSATSAPMRSNDARKQRRTGIPESFQNDASVTEEQCHPGLMGGGDNYMLKLFINMKLAIARLAENEEGQGLTEYALILALIAIAAIVALQFLGGKVNDALSTVGSSLNTA